MEDYLALSGMHTLCRMYSDLKQQGWEMSYFIDVKFHWCKTDSQNDVHSSNIRIIYIIEFLIFCPYKLGFGSI